MAERTGIDWSRWLEGWRGRVVVVLGTGVLILLVGYVIGGLLVSGTPASTRTAAIARLDAITPGSLVAAPDAKPKKLAKPRGMGSQHAGVAVLAVSGVDEVRTGGGPRRASEGSTLLAFRLGDWACEVQPCESWETLKPQVVVDGDSQEVPDDGDTFVVVVPPGAAEVSLRIDADGYAQSVSLLGDDPGPGNIVLLSSRDTEKPVTIDQRFQLAEQTSIVLGDGLGGKTDRFTRDVGVDAAQLRFFLDTTRPSSPRRAFLLVNAYYSYPGRPGRYVFGPGEAVFVGKDGTRYDARDLDPSPDHSLLGFEVPATLRQGTLILGGSTDKTSTTGVPYVATVAEQQVPISLG
jgi:hypothetical protein